MSIERIGLSPASPLRWLAHQKPSITLAPMRGASPDAVEPAVMPLARLPRCPNRQAMQSAKVSTWDAERAFDDRVRLSVAHARRLMHFAYAEPTFEPRIQPEILAPTTWRKSVHRSGRRGYAASLSFP